MGRAVFLGAFAVLVAFCAPALYLRDSGELTTAAFTLGVAHETGFSLFCLLGKLFTLVPLGEVATRLAVASAFMGALTAWILYRLVRELSGDAAAGVGAAVILVAGFTFFKASTVAEVYASSACAIALCLWLLARAEKGSGKAGVALALVGGLSLGLHAQLRILVGPACALFALSRLRKGARWPLFAPLAVAVGGAVVAYLPLRAARHPAANWSDPETLGGVVRHLAAHRIRAAFADQILTRDLGLLGERLLAFARLVEGQLGVLVLLAALGGLYWLLRERRALGLVVLALLVGDALYSAWINPMGMEDLQDGAPTAVALALCAGLGLYAAARRFPKRAQPFAVGALAFIVALPAALADSDGKLGLAFEAGSYVRAALAEAPPRGSVYGTSDDLLAGSLYEQAVAGTRPDVTVIARQQTARLRPELPSPWEGASDAPPFGVLQPDVPLQEWSAPPPPALPDARPLARRMSQILEPARDPFARRLFADSLTSLGRTYLVRGDEAQARWLFEVALKSRPNDDVAATDLAVVRARGGDLRGALALCDQVLARDPSRQVARLNAARYRLQLSDLDGAERDFRAYLRRAPRSAPAWVGLARVAARKGDQEGARKDLEKALEIDPKNAEAAGLLREL